MKNRETVDVQNPALIAVGSMPDVLIWRNHVGKFRAIHNPERIITIGSPGMADSLGVVMVTITPEMVGKQVGVAISAEYKQPGKHPSKDQIRWGDAFRKRGGVHRVIRSAAEMLQLVSDVKNGVWE